MEQFAPNILLQPEDCIFHINDQIELKCCAKAYPSPAYQWSKNNVKLPGEVHSTLLVYYNHYNVADHFKRFMIYLDFQCIHRSFWLLRLPHLQCARRGSYERSSNFGEKVRTLENYYSANVSK